MSDRKLPAKDVGAFDYYRRPGKLKRDDDKLSSVGKNERVIFDPNQLYPSFDKSHDDDKHDEILRMMDRSDLTTCAETKSLSDSSATLQVYLVEASSKASVSRMELRFSAS